MIKISLERAARNPAASLSLPELPFEADGMEIAWRTISNWPGYAPSPIRDLSDLAAELDLGKIWFKDESVRFGVGQFQAAWRSLRRQSGAEPPSGRGDGYRGTRSFVL